MQVIVFGLFLFLDVLKLIVWIDVILSWIGIFGINIRPKVIKDMLNPIYSFIERHIPTNFGPFNLKALILIFGIYILQSVLLNYFPAISSLYSYFY